MPVNPNVLKHSIVNNKIENIYLFSGSEIGEKKEIINLIEKKLFNDDEPVKFTFYCGNDFDTVEFISTLQTRQLFSDKKIVYLKNIENVDSGSIKMLTDYVINPSIDKIKFENQIYAKLNENNKKNILKYYKENNNYYTLVMTLTGADKKSIVSIFNSAGFKCYDCDTYLVMLNETKDKIPQGLTDLLTENQNIIFWEMFDSQKSEWVKSEFRKNNLFIENDALDFILDTIENNKDQLKNEIDKISMLFTDKAQNDNIIKKTFIEEYLYHSKEETAFTLYSSMLKGDIEKSLEILETVFYSDEDSLLYGLVWSHRRFLKALDLYENQKMTLDDIYKNLYITNKNNKADFENGFKRYNFYQASMMFYHLSELDYFIKVLPSNLKLIKLQEFVIKFISKNQQTSFLKGDLQYTSY